MKLSTAVQDGCGYKDTLRAHRYFAPLTKYFTVCITYQPPLVYWQIVMKFINTKCHETTFMMFSILSIECCFLGGFGRIWICNCCVWSLLDVPGTGFEMVVQFVRCTSCCTWDILAGIFLTCHIYICGLFRFFRQEFLDCVVRGKCNFDVGFFLNLGFEQGLTAGVCEFGPSVVFIVLFWFFLLVLDLV